LLGQDPITEQSGLLSDQAALMGLLQYFHAHGISLFEVKRLGSDM